MTARVCVAGAAHRDLKSIQSPKGATAVPHKMEIMRLGLSTSKARGQRQHQQVARTHAPYG